MMTLPWRPKPARDLTGRSHQHTERNRGLHPYAWHLSPAPPGVNVDRLQSYDRWSADTPDASAEQEARVGGRPEGSLTRGAKSGSEATS